MHASICLLLEHFLESRVDVLTAHPIKLLLPGSAYISSFMTSANLNKIDSNVVVIGDTKHCVLLLEGASNCFYIYPNGWFDAVFITRTLQKIALTGRYQTLLLVLESYFVI